MKNLIIGTLAIISFSASAYMIEGTQMLKGTIKTKITVNSVTTTCRVQIEKVKNLMLEDSFGNPAYHVRADISLDGNDYARSLAVKYDKEVWFNNLFKTTTGTEVRDLDYFSEDGSTIKIDRNGRLKVLKFPFQGQTISCLF